MPVLSGRSSSSSHKQPSSVPLGDYGRSYGFALFSSVIQDLGLLTLSALLFGLSFPSFISFSGWGFLGFIALVPLFIVIRRAGWLKIFLYAPVFGWGSYAVFNYWLSTFHPLAIMIVPTIYATYYLAVLPLLKLASVLFPRRGYLAQVVVWVGYEFLRTKGFLGYPYGILGYSQYLFLPFIQIAEFTGIWGVTALVVFPNTFLGAALSQGLKEFKPFLHTHRRILAGYGALVVLTLVFGFVSLGTDYTRDREGNPVPEWKVALVQHNADTWEGGFRAYERNVRTMIRLSEEALAEDPGVEAVIWSETSVVPGIDWHTRYRTDPLRYGLVQELVEYLSEKDVPFIFGNDDGQAVKDSAGNPLLDSLGNMQRVDYNAVVHFQDGAIQGIYRKTHLVPFTEHFPYEETLPRIYALLEANDYHFWEKGTEYTVFDLGKVKISTPICFEDVFGYISRRFVAEGAEVIVNLTNDSWSKSEAAEMQHGAMAVFRAIENRRSLIRSTNAGITCTILPSGKITAQLDPFIEAYMIGTVPVYTEKTTGYALWGDFLGWFSLWGGLFLLAAGVVLRLLQRKRPAD
jgi:apolipoprotein N-acyltransferase